MSAVTLEDRVEIRDLYERFYWALDAGDTEIIKGSFAPDAKLIRYAGPPKDAEFSAAVGAKFSQDPVGKTYQHHLTACIVDPDPEGREDFRAVRIYFLLTGVFEPPEIIVRWSVRTHDVVQRIDGEWRFVSRQVILNHPATGPKYIANEPHHPDNAP